MPQWPTRCLRRGRPAGPTRGCMAAKAPHPNCAYKWMKWVSTPTVQAEQAISFGETPVNSLACPIMDQMQAGSCAGYHADKPDAYFKTIKFWKTPLVELRKREDRLHPLFGVDERLDPSHRVTRGGARTSGQEGGPVSAALMRRAWLRTTLLLSPPSGLVPRHLRRLLVIMLITSLWSVNSFTQTIDHSPHDPELPPDRVRAPIRRSSAGRSCSRRS